MAVLSMSLYDDLEKDIRSAKQNNEVYTIHMTRIKEDLGKRKRGWMARLIILCAWLVIFAVGALVVSGAISLGGSASTLPEGGAPMPDTEDLGIDPIAAVAIFIAGMFPVMTWTLCFVGFPIGWGWIRAGKDTAESGIANLILSLIVGAFTMSFSVIIAIVQLFTWKKAIKRIEGIIAEVENNELFELD